MAIINYQLSIINYKRVFLALCLCLCVLPLSAQQRYFSIEVRQPAERQLPEGISSILLVNNAAVQPVSFGHQSKRNDEVLPSIEIDLSDAARQCLFGLQSAFESSDLFDEVNLLPTSQHQGSFFKRSLLGSRADSLIAYYGVDALFSLNQLVLYDLCEVYATDADTHYAYLQAYSTAHWSIHLPGRAPIAFSLSDTLTWSHEAIESTAALSALPDRRTALLDFAYTVGEQTGKQFYPQWQTEDRYMYYAHSEVMDRAWDLFRHMHFSEALATWQALFSDSSQPALLRAYAAANMAVASELLEDFSLAIRFSSAAASLLQPILTLDAQQQRVNLLSYRDRLTLRRDSSR